jgi:hypothetical protein
MSPVLAVLLALQNAPAQNSTLAIADERFTYGHLGPTRKDNDFLPGDVVCLAFNINNMKFDAAGRASFSIAMEVFDNAGTSRFKQLPRNATAQNYLGGTLLPSVAELQIPLATPPGEYTIRMTIEDRAAKAKTTLERKARVLPADFGLIHVHTTADREGKTPITPIAAVGESLYVNFAAVGFQRDGDKKQPNIEVAMRILDEKGNATTPRPLTGKANSDIPADFQIIPLQFGLTLNRAGRFTVELSATDRLSGKSARVSIPIQVVAFE